MESGLLLPFYMLGKPNHNIRFDLDKLTMALVDDAKFERSDTLILRYDGLLAKGDLDSRSREPGKNQSSSQRKRQEPKKRIDCYKDICC